MELHAIPTFYTARHGMVTLEDDVLSIVRQVKQVYGDRVVIELDDHTGVYHFIEHCEDGTDRLIFTTDHLDNRDLERLMRADSTGRLYEDPYDAAEREQDELQAAIDESKMDGVRDAAERLAWALGDGKHGPGVHQSIHVKRDIRADSNG